MAFASFPDLIIDKIAFYQWKNSLKVVHQHFAFHPEDDLNVYVITSQTRLTQTQAICGLIKAKGDICKFADSAFHDNDHLKDLIKYLSVFPELI